MHTSGPGLSTLTLRPLLDNVCGLLAIRTSHLLALEIPLLVRDICIDAVQAIALNLTVSFVPGVGANQRPGEPQWLAKPSSIEPQGMGLVQVLYVSSYVPCWCIDSF